MPSARNKIHPLERVIIAPSKHFRKSRLTVSLGLFTPNDKAKSLGDVAPSPRLFAESLITSLRRFLVSPRNGRKRIPTWVHFFGLIIALPSTEHDKNQSGGF
jgi:hypothetical protein